MEILQLTEFKFLMSPLIFLKISKGLLFNPMSAGAAGGCVWKTNSATVSKNGHS